MNTVENRGFMVAKTMLKALLSKLGILEISKIYFNNYKLRCLAKAKGFDLQISKSGAISISTRGKKNKRTIRIAKKHSVYAHDMINYFEYYFNAVVPEISGERIVDYSLPKEHILKHSGLKFYFNSLPESDETTIVYLEKAKLKEGMVVFDLGAYCGASTYFFAKAIGSKGKVFCFEPDEENFTALQKNIKSHSLNNVFPVKKGIWSTTTSLVFQSEGNMGSAIQNIVGRNSNTKIIEVLSLEDAFLESGASKIDFIKMDIEGTEVEVLGSSKQFLMYHRPKIVIEPHYLNGKMNTQIVLDILKDIGYECELLTQGAMDFPLIYAH